MKGRQGGDVAERSSAETAATAAELRGGRAPLIVRVPGFSWASHLGDGIEVLFLEATRRERGRAHADTTRDERRFVARHGVLIDRDVGELEHRLDACAYT